MQIKVASKNDFMYSQTSTNGHLATTAIFLADSPYIHFVSASLQWPLSSVHKVGFAQSSTVIQA